MMQQQFDLAIITSYHQDVLAAEWFHTVKEVGRSAMIVTPNPNEFFTLKEQGVEVAYVKNYFPETVPSIAKIKEYFKALGIDDMEDYVATERSYYQQSYSHLLKYSYCYAYAFNKLFREIG